jgi:hypothetical protein
MEYKLIILEQLLLENRIQQVMNRFNTRRGRNLVSKVAAEDPSDNQKYLAWIVKSLTNNDDNSEYLQSKNYAWKNRLLSRYIDAVTYFQQNQQRFEKKDINQYKGSVPYYPVIELESAIALVKEKQSQKEERAKAKKGAKKIYEDENIFVVMPKTHEASCYYGRGSRWCTTSRDTSQHFEDYSGDGYLFYFIVKNPVEGDRRYYKMAMYLGVYQSFLEMTEDVDYYIDEDYEDYGETAEEFVNYWCEDVVGGDCVEESCFDAPDDQYGSLESYLRSDNKNSLDVKNSFRKAKAIIDSEYRPIIKSFVDELVDFVKYKFNEYVHGDATSEAEKIHKRLLVLAKKAGIENPESLSFMELISKIKEFQGRNRNFSNIDVDYGGFGRRNPLTDR